MLLFEIYVTPQYFPTWSTQGLDWVVGSMGCCRFVRALVRARRAPVYADDLRASRLKQCCCSARSS